MHRLEEALQLTEALHLTQEQKSKIVEMTKKQAEESHALCVKAHEAHLATHVQILALLTPDQRQKLHSMESAGPDHCAIGELAPAGGQECHAVAVH